jgi:hypothetical protein
MRGHEIRSRKQQGVRTSPTDSTAPAGPPPYRDGKSYESYVRDFGWEIAHGAVSRRPPVSLDTIEARTEAYTHAATVL